MMAPNVLEDCTPLYVRRLSLYYLTSAIKGYRTKSVAVNADGTS